VVVDIILLWAAKESADSCAWVANASPGVRVVLVAPAALATAVPAALARGAVIAVVDGHRDAHRALALGVDEVVRANAATAEAFSEASERARLRAGAREARPRTLDGDAKAIELLAASVSFRLAQPLAMASLNVEILRAAVGAVAGLADAYARDAADLRGLPVSEAQRVVAMRASAPATPSLHATVNDLSTALREASSAVAHVYSLVVPDHENFCDLTTVVSETTKLVSVVIERIADFRVELPGDDPCRATVRRSVVVHALSALLTNAVQAVRDLEGRRGVITVRLVPRVTAALLEVVDNGVGMGPTVLERAIQPFFSTRGPGAAGLGLTTVAERVRGEGGDIVLESEVGRGTTARLFLPLLVRPEEPRPGSN
jgi:signal transduction histidine kinase